MKGIDTNVLVRYIVQDDPKQSQLASHFLEKEHAKEASIFINGIILCELVWVLETAYNYPKLDIAEVLEKILKTSHFFIYQPEILWKSLRNYRNDSLDFADSYIAHLNAANECEYTATFDKKAARLPLFKLPPLN
ncbi:MAG: type II toxin-antitoxin system VapC family toxin [Gammaproteobacteria bacterium]